MSCGLSFDKWRGEIIRVGAGEADHFVQRMDSSTSKFLLARFHVDRIVSRGTLRVIDVELLARRYVLGSRLADHLRGGGRGI